MLDVEAGLRQAEGWCHHYGRQGCGHGYEDQQDQQENVHRVMLVTSDDRVPELIETVNNFTSKLNSDVPLDLIVT